MRKIRDGQDPQNCVRGLGRSAVNQQAVIKDNAPLPGGSRPSSLDEPPKPYEIELWAGNGIVKNRLIVDMNKLS